MVASITVEAPAVYSMLFPKVKAATLDDRSHEQILLQAVEGRELLGEVVGVVARREGLFAGVHDEFASVL